jgi:hypothetical protein
MEKITGMIRISFSPVAIAQWLFAYLVIWVLLTGYIVMVNWDLNFKMSIATVAEIAAILVLLFALHVQIENRKFMERM